MATKWFLTTSPTPVAPTFTASTEGFGTGGWEDSTSAFRASLQSTMAGTNTAASVAKSVVAAAHDVAIGQWVSTPILRAGTFTGECTVVFARLEAPNASANLATRVLAKVVSNDGLTLRDHALGGITTEWPTVLTAEDAIFTLTAVACQPGDRIVIEVGYRAATAAVTPYTGTIRYGGTDAAALAAGDTGTAATTRSPFIVFDDAAVDALFAPFASATLGALTATAAGTVGGPSAGVTGAASAALGPLGATALGARTVTGQAAVGLGALTATATGSREVTGTATAPLPALHATAAGTRNTPGSAGAPLGPLTAAAAGTRNVAGTAVAPLGPLTATAVGDSLPPSTGAGNAQLGPLGATATGTVEVVGTATTSSGFTAAATGTRNTHGQASTVLGALIANAAGDGVTITTGTAEAILGALLAAATGTTNTLPPTGPIHAGTPIVSAGLRASTPTETAGVHAGTPTVSGVLHAGTPAPV